MHFITNLKHWQLFLIFIILSNIHYFGMPLSVSILIGLVLFALWHYAVVIHIHNKAYTDQEESHSIDFFKASCYLFPILWTANTWNYLLVQKSPPTSGGHIMFIVAIGAVLTYCYMIWYTSGALLKAEPVNRRGAVNRMLILLWLVLFPIGIWFIQPKVNRL
jgi:hypothetical protein